MLCHDERWRLQSNLVIQEIFSDNSLNKQRIHYFLYSVPKYSDVTPLSFLELNFLGISSLLFSTNTQLLFLFHPPSHKYAFRAQQIVHLCCCFFSFYDCERAGHSNDSLESSSHLLQGCFFSRLVNTPRDSSLCRETRVWSHVCEPHRCQQALLMLGNCWGRFMPRNRVRLPFFVTESFDWRAISSYHSGIALEQHSMHKRL